MSLPPIKIGRKVGYKEHSRNFDKQRASRVDASVQGEFVSKAGNVWRFYGLYYPGVLLVDWTRNKAHSIAYTTLFRLESLGFIWRPDSKPRVKFEVSRWPDGTHFYCTTDKGEPIPNPQLCGGYQFPTWGAAHAAGVVWEATRKI